ncbi:MAG: hypothetical protein OXC05_07020 [Halieaceae bacterium]|nr:hypothetical protein [Halieaceae bacterium]
MITTTRISLMLLLVVVLLSGCTGLQQAAKIPHPAAGAWDFNVDMMQGPEKGIFTIMEADEALSGTIVMESGLGDWPLENVMFDGSELSFDFDSGQYGVMKVKVHVEGDAFKGTWTLARMGMSMPMAGTRQVK